MIRGATERFDDKKSYDRGNAFNEMLCEDDKMLMDVFQSEKS